LQQNTLNDLRQRRRNTVADETVVGVLGALPNISPLRQSHLPYYGRRPS